jgi:nitric oxide reductase NorD protein
MAEPEELILEGAHFATRVARDAWRRHAARTTSRVSLSTIRTRLELFVAGLTGQSLPIVTLSPPPARTWLARFSPDRSVRPGEGGLAATDGERIYLAGSLDLAGGTAQTMTAYRLLALQQAVRVLRGSAAISSRLPDQAARDLFMIADGEAVDRWIAVHAPGLRADVVEARRVALGERGTRTSRAPDSIETMLRRVLASDPRLSALGLEGAVAAAACAAWARQAAKSAVARRGRGVAAPLYWGQLLEAVSTFPKLSPDPADLPDVRAQRPRVAELRRQPRAREAPDDEDDQETGSWVIRADEPQESVEDPHGLQRPADREQHADAEGLADSLADLPEARVVRTPDQAREVLSSPEGRLPRDHDGDSPREVAGIAYPEWDYRSGSYRHPGAVVRPCQGSAGDPEWGRSTLSRHAALVRRVRTRFQRLRPRLSRLFRQSDGSDIDVPAYVTAEADRRAGAAVDGHYYVDTRRARRDVAVALLLDVSASTDAWVSTNRRIVDVEKEAMLIVCEALDTLGDPYGLFAFSSDGPSRVTVATLKAFDEPTSIVARRRIAALDSAGYTRLGAAIRHVTATLGGRQTASRLLLLLSDGKPNDVDLYEGRYGMEDTRQSVMEARRQGVTVFCLTVDREAPRYAGRVFGRRRFAVLQKPEQLPRVVIDVLRQHVRG